MKTITLEKAVELLDSAYAIVVDSSELLCPSLEDLTGEDDNNFLYLGEENERKFSEGDNKEVKTNNLSIFLKNTDGEEVEISFLELSPLE